MTDRLQRRPVSIHYKRNVAMSELPCVTASLQIDLLSRISSYWFCLIDPLISPRSYTISFYVNWFVPKETAVLHQEDEPGDLPIKLTVLWGNGRRFWSHLCMVSRGKAKIFSNESLVNSSVPRRPPRGFVTSYCPTLGRTA